MANGDADVKPDDDSDVGARPAPPSAIPNWGESTLALNVGGSSSPPDWPPSPLTASTETALPTAPRPDPFAAYSPENMSALSAELAEIEKRRAAQQEFTNKHEYLFAQRDRDRMEQSLNTMSADKARMPPPWNADQEYAARTRGPIETFGSLGSIFGILASGFTRTPMTSALNASAAAMTAMHQQDQAGYERAYQAWLDNTNLAVKRFNMERSVFEDTNKLFNTDLQMWKVRTLADAARFDNQRTIALLNAGMHPEILEMQAKGVETMAKIAETRDKLIEFEDKRKLVEEATAAWDAAHPRGTVTENERALARINIRREVMLSGKDALAIAERGREFDLRLQEIKLERERREEQEKTRQAEAERAHKATEADREARQIETERANREREEARIRADEDRRQAEIAREEDRKARQAETERANREREETRARAEEDRRQAKQAGDEAKKLQLEEMVRSHRAREDEARERRIQQRMNFQESMELKREKAKQLTPAERRQYEHIVSVEDDLTKAIDMLDRDPRVGNWLSNLGLQWWNFAKSIPGLEYDPTAADFQHKISTIKAQLPSVLGASRTLKASYGDISNSVGALQRAGTYKDIYNSMSELRDKMKFFRESIEDHGIPSREPPPLTQPPVGGQQNSLTPDEIGLLKEGVGTRFEGKPGRWTLKNGQPVKVSD